MSRGSLKLKPRVKGSAFVFKRLGTEFERLIFAKPDKSTFPVEHELYNVLRDIVGNRWNKAASRKLMKRLGEDTVQKLGNVETSIEALLIIRRRLESEKIRKVHKIKNG